MARELEAHARQGGDVDAARVLVESLRSAFELARSRLLALRTPVPLGSTMGGRGA